MTFSGFDKLEEFCDTFNLTNVIKSETCYTNNHKMTIDLLFTNKPLSFQRTSTTVVTTETGSSDCHNLISLFVRSFVSPLMPKAIFFRNYQKFDYTKFESNLKNTNLSFTSANTNENYLFLRNSFSKKNREICSFKKENFERKSCAFCF